MELLLRINAVELITETGFNVVEAGNAEAIAILEGRPDIHIVFTDIQMPGRWTASNWRGSSGEGGRR